MPSLFTVNKSNVALPDVIKKIRVRPVKKAEDDKIRTT